MLIFLFSVNLILPNSLPYPDPPPTPPSPLCIYYIGRTIGQSLKMWSANWLHQLKYEKDRQEIHTFQRNSHWKKKSRGCNSIHTLDGWDVVQAYNMLFLCILYTICYLRWCLILRGVGVGWQTLLIHLIPVTVKVNLL